MDIIVSILDSARLEMWGHEIFPGGVALNLFFAILVPVWIKLYRLARLSRDKTLIAFTGISMLAFLPNTLYLVFESRHVLIKDGIAEPVTFSAMVFFLLIGCLGIYLTVRSILQIATDRNGKKNTVLIVVLSTLSSFGAVLGLFDIHSFSWVLIPVKTFQIAVSIIKTPGLIFLVLASGTVLSAFCTSPEIYRKIFLYYKRISSNKRKKLANAA